MGIRVDMYGRLSVRLLCVRAFLASTIRGICERARHIVVATAVMQTPHSPKRETLRQKEKPQP